MTTLVTTNVNAYPLSAIPLTSKHWKYVEGARVRHYGDPDSETWVVLKRLAIAPFPHYEVMDDLGHCWIVSQLTLITA